MEEGMCKPMAACLNGVSVVFTSKVKLDLMTFSLLGHLECRVGLQESSDLTRTRSSVSD
jgi:hypothetical protein